MKLLGMGQSKRTLRRGEIRENLARIRDDNRRTRTGNAFITTSNPVKRQYIGSTPKCTTCNFHHPPKTPRHFAKDCRVVLRNVNPINARNLTAKACYECGSTDYIKAACLRLNQAQRPGGNQQNQVVVVNRGQGRRKNGNRHIEGHSCWEQRRLSRIRTL
nr:hypothetical protein [Tanacetum cinerariifolium]